MRPSVLMLLLFVGAYASAERRPGNESEIELIRAALGADEIPEWSQREVLDVGGAYSSPPDSADSVLTGWVLYRPTLVQNALCLAERHWRSGTQSGSDYEWRLPSKPELLYWRASSAAQCDIVDASQIPVEAVRAGENIPTAQMVQIIDNAQELFIATLERMRAEIASNEEISTNPLSVTYLQGLITESATDSTVRLYEVSSGHAVGTDYGVAFHASFRGSRSQHGLTVTFSIVDRSIVVHGVGRWIA